MVQSRWYKSGWTDERRAKQCEAIQRWKPWEKSTGPKTPQGKLVVAANGRWAHLKRLTGRQLLKIIRQF